MRVSTVGRGAAGASSATLRVRKRSFQLGTVVQRIRHAVRPLPKAAMFALAEEGHHSVFEQLVACILSIRTRDEVSLVAALPAERIDTFIRDTTFHTAKAHQIRGIARAVDGRHAGALPRDEAVLRAVPGVGSKCAHVALGIACGSTLISVDVHVHRVTNRWGYVRAMTPEQTMAELERKLPARYWIELNSLLVPFGKHVCTGRLPRCSTCPVLDMCLQVGVEAHR